MNVAPTIAERKKQSGLKEAVADVLTFNTFTSLVDAWNRDPDPNKITWDSLGPWKTTETLGHASVEACQHVIDEQRAQASFLTVCGETCVVRNDVIIELKRLLGR